MPRLVLFVAGALAALTGCSAGSDAQSGATGEAADELARVAGSALLPDGAAPPADAALEVELLDVSTGDVPSVLSRTRLRNPGSGPMHFVLDYDAARIDPAHRYTVQARLLEAGVVRYATDTPYPAVTQDAGHVVTVRLVEAGAAGTPAATAAPTTDGGRPSVSGRLEDGSGDATYYAWLDPAGTSVLRLEEDRRLAPAGNVRAEYQYRGGRLLRYIELRRDPGADAGEGVDSSLDLVFDEAGELLAATRRVAGRAMPPDPAEIDRVRNRAGLLRSHALALQAGSTHTR